MRRSVKKAAAFLLAFALVFSMAGSGRMVVSAQQAAETAAGSVEEKAQVLPSQQNVGTQDENSGTPQENVQNEEPQPGGETPSGSEGGTEDENGPSDQGQNTDENGGETPSGENPSEDNSSEKPSGDEPAPADPSEDTSDKEDGKDPSGVTDGKEEPSTDGTSGTEGGTTDGSSDDQTVSGNDVPEEEASGEDAGENAPEGSVSGNSVSANRIPSGQMAANGIAAMAISGSYEVPVGDTITLEGSWPERLNHDWNVQSNGDVIEIGWSYGNTVEITGIKEGTASIRHTCGYYFDKKEEIIEITVISKQEGSYDLYVYTLIPGVAEGSSENANDLWNGMAKGTITGVNDPTTETVNTVLYSGDEAIRNLDNVNIDEGNFPNIYNPADGKWYKYATTEEEKDTEGYYTIQWMRIKVANGANKGNNEYFGPVDPVPSHINAYHLDGVLILNEKDYCSVHFSLKDAGENEFVILDEYSERVTVGYSANKLNRPSLQEEKEVGGIKYVFDGWYKDPECKEKVENWDSETITKNPTIYYAQYIPAAQNITIKKEVTGGLGDVQKSFEFTYSYQDTSGQPQTESFILKDNESTELENIPAGTTLTLSETNASGYTISASYNGETINAENGVMVISIVEGCTEITVTNNKEVTPDTGILLDSAPHVLGLLLVTAGAAALLTGRRKEHLS